MKIRKLYFVLAVAFLVAAAIAYQSVSLSYPESLIRIQAQERLGKIDPRIVDEPLEVQALLLDYLDGDAAPGAKSDGDELALKAWIALMKYPEPSRQVLGMFGNEPKFQAILRQYGEGVIPVIKYFLDNDIKSVKVLIKAGEIIVATKEKVGQMVDGAKRAASEAWDQLRHKSPASAPEPPNVVPPETSPPAPPVPTAPETVTVQLEPTQRGWYAINAINNDGHKFLGQFAVDAAHVAHWNQTDRTVAAVADFLTGGVSNLERKYELHEKIEGGDVFFAAVDILPFVAAVKLLRVGKVASTTGKELSVLSKTRVFAARLLPSNANLMKLGKFGAVLATGYVVLKHPGLLNSLFGELAKLMGLPPFLVQFAGWFLLISIVLYPFLGLLKIAANVIGVGLSWLNRPAKRESFTAGAQPLAGASA